MNAILDVVVGDRRRRITRCSRTTSSSDPRAPAAHRPPGSPARPGDPVVRVDRARRRVRRASRLGGVLSQVTREVIVEALPMNVPDRLELDISALEIGDSLRVSDLDVPEGVTLLDDPDEVLASVIQPRVEGAEAVEEESRAKRAKRAPRARRRRGRGGAPRRDGRRRVLLRGLMRFLRRGGTPRRSICSSRGSATRAASTRDTRHNVGFMVVDELARRHGGTFRSKFSGDLSELRIDGHRVALLKPQTYMNESGRSVAARREVLQGRAGVAARRPRRGRSRAGTAAGAAGRRPRRAQRPALGRAVARDAGVPAAAHRRRPARSAAIRGRWPTACSPRSRPRSTSMRSSPAPRTRSRRSSATGSTRPSATSTSARDVIVSPNPREGRGEHVQVGRQAPVAVPRHLVPRAVHRARVGGVLGHRRQLHPREVELGEQDDPAQLRQRWRAHAEGDQHGRAPCSCLHHQARQGAVHRQQEYDGHETAAPIFSTGSTHRRSRWRDLRTPPRSTGSIRSHSSRSTPSSAASWAGRSTT